MSNPLPSSQLSALRETADKATPGPWKAVPVNEEGLSCIPHPHWDICTDEASPTNVGCLITSGESSESDPDAEFIAAFNPSVARALLDRLEALEKDRERMGRALDQIADAGDDIEEMAAFFVSTMDTKGLQNYGRNIANIALAARQAGPEDK